MLEKPYTSDMAPALIESGSTVFSALATRTRWKIVNTNSGATMTVCYLKQFLSRAISGVKLQKKVSPFLLTYNMCLREFVQVITLQSSLCRFCAHTLKYRGDFVTTTFYPSLLTLNSLTNKIRRNGASDIATN